MGNKRFAIIAGILFSVIGIILLRLSWNCYSSTRTFLVTAVITAGEVKELRKVGITSFAPVFVYSDSKGRSYEKVSDHSSDPPSYKVGEIVEVIYDKSNPQEARIKSFTSLWLGLTILVLLDICFLFVGVWVLIAIRRSTVNHVIVPQYAKKILKTHRIWPRTGTKSARRVEPLLAALREVKREKAGKGVEVNCPKCGLSFLVSPDEDAIICPNLDCRAVPKAREQEEKSVFEGKATIQGSEGTKIVDCRVREGHVIIGSKEPLRIPLGKIESCDINTPSLPHMSGSGITETVLSTVKLRYFDSSGECQIAVFQMSYVQGCSLRDAIFEPHSMQHGWQPWFERLQVSSPEVAGLETGEETSSFESLDETFLGTKDKICAGLRSLGVDAQVDMSGRAAEQNLGAGLQTKPDRVIDIAKGPIRWVNIRKQEARETASSYFIDYGVPDPRLRPDLPNLPKIKSVHKTSYPIVGTVVDLYWKGKDSGLGIIDRLNRDILVRQQIMRTQGMKIRAYGDFRCWTISTWEEDPPSGELWNCYQAIAKHLLAEWSPN